MHLFSPPPFFLSLRFSTLETSPIKNRFDSQLCIVYIKMKELVRTHWDNNKYPSNDKYFLVVVQFVMNFDLSLFIYLFINKKKITLP
jgi:hypothetical protein